MICNTDECVWESYRKFYLTIHPSSGVHVFPDNECVSSMYVKRLTIDKLICISVMRWIILLNSEIMQIHKVYRRGTCERTLWKALVLPYKVFALPKSAYTYIKTYYMHTYPCMSCQLPLFHLEDNEPTTYFEEIHLSWLMNYSSNHLYSRALLPNDLNKKIMKRIKMFACLFEIIWTLDSQTLDYHIFEI